MSPGNLLVVLRKFPKLVVNVRSILNSKNRFSKKLNLNFLDSKHT